MDRGHNRLRDWLGHFIGDLLVVPVLPEVPVQAWNYIKDGREVQARLDLSFPWSGVRTYIDVAYTNAASDCFPLNLTCPSKESNSWNAVVQHEEMLE